VDEMALASFWYYQCAWNIIDIVRDKKLITYAVYNRTSKEELINMKLFERVAAKGHFIRKDYHNNRCNLHKDRSKQSNSRPDVFVRRGKISQAA
jgi:hypothetical protein